MKLTILYFGMIEEITNRREEIISLPSGSTIEQLEKFIKDKYEKLQHLSFKISIDKEISSEKVLLNSSNEIALLPPFSGG